ncbi:DUF2341 domain-containing protein [archaeon]|nr:DUF2341 domain-containing protein [archaeon]
MQKSVFAIILFVLFFATVNATVEYWQQSPEASIRLGTKEQRVSLAYVYTDKLELTSKHYMLVVHDTNPGIENPTLRVYEWNNMANQWFKTTNLFLENVVPPLCDTPKIDVECNFNSTGIQGLCWMVVGCKDGTIDSYRWNRLGRRWQGDTTILNGPPRTEMFGEVISVSLGFDKTYNKQWNWPTDPTESGSWKLIVTSDTMGHLPGKLATKGFIWNNHTETWLDRGNITWNALWKSAPYGANPDMSFNMSGNTEFVTMVGFENWIPQLQTNTWINAYVLSKITSRGADAETGSGGTRSRYWYRDSSYEENLDSVWGYNGGVWTPGGWNFNDVKLTSGNNLQGNKNQWLFAGQNYSDIIYAFYWRDEVPPRIGDIHPQAGRWQPMDMNKGIGGISEAANCIHAINRPDIDDYDDLEALSDPSLNCHNQNPSNPPDFFAGYTYLACEIHNLLDWQLVPGGYNLVTIGCKDRKDNKDDSSTITRLPIYVDLSAPKGTPSPLTGTLYTLGDTVNLNASIVEASEPGKTLTWLEINESGSNQEFNIFPWADLTMPSREKIKIQNRDAMTGENYTIELDIPYSEVTGAQTDFSDIKFYDREGRPLGHWRETYTSGTTAHFKILYNHSVMYPFGTNHTIVMYYGSGISDIGSPRSAVVYYNDFSNGNFNPVEEMGCGDCRGSGGSSKCWDDFFESEIDYNAAREAVHFKVSTHGVSTNEITNEYIDFSKSSQWSDGATWPTYTPSAKAKISFVDGVTHKNDFSIGFPIYFGLSDNTGSYFDDTENGTMHCGSSFIGFKAILDWRVDIDGIVPTTGAVQEVPIAPYLRNSKGQELVGPVCDYIPIDGIEREFLVEIHGYASGTHNFHLESDGKLCAFMDNRKLPLGQVDWKYFIFSREDSEYDGPIISAGPVPHTPKVEGYLHELQLQQLMPNKDRVNAFFENAEDRDSLVGSYEYGKFSSPQLVNPLTENASFDWSNSSTLLVGNDVCWRIHMEDSFNYLNTTDWNCLYIQDAPSENHPRIVQIQDDSTGSFQDSNSSGTYSIDVEHGTSFNFRAWANDTDCNIVGCNSNEPESGTPINPTCAIDCEDSFTNSSITWNMSSLTDGILFVGNFSENPSEKSSAALGVTQFDITNVTYFLDITINDSTGRNGSELLAINVILPSLMPEANATVPAQCTIGTDITPDMDGLLSLDPLGMGLAYDWTIAGVDVLDGNGTYCGGGSCMIVQNYPCPSPAGTYDITLTVTDGLSRTDDDTVQIEAVDPSGPTVTDLKVTHVDYVSPLIAKINTNFTITVENQGDQQSGAYNLSYNITDDTDQFVAGGWKIEPSLSSDTHRKNMTFWIPTESGLYNIEVRISDGVNTLDIERRELYVTKPSEGLTGDEYPLLPLLMILLAIPIIVYYSNRRNK